MEGTELAHAPFSPKPAASTICVTSQGYSGHWGLLSIKGVVPEEGVREVWRGVGGASIEVHK